MPYFPPVCLRTEILEVLESVGEDSRCVCLPPAAVAELINDAGGPPLGISEIPYIEVLLDDLFEDGVVGRVPPPSSTMPSGYIIRDAAERAIEIGAFVYLKPTRNTH